MDDKYLKPLFPWQTMEYQNEELEINNAIRAVLVGVIRKNTQLYDIKNEVVRFYYPTVDKYLSIWTNEGAYSYGKVNRVHECKEGKKEYITIETNVASVKFRILNNPSNFNK